MPILTDAQVMEARDDYLNALRDIGISHEIAASQSSNNSDYRPIDIRNSGVSVGASSISGDGVFANAAFKQGAMICPARIGTNRTQCGKFTNHSGRPNCMMASFGDDILLIAISDIEAGDELTVDYRDAMSINVQLFNQKTYDEKVDAIECELLKYPLIEVPTTHTFTKNPGMYVREAFAPAGSILTSKIHKTEHPFVMLKGEQSILENDGTWTRVKAPCWGITKAGSRRVVLVHEDTIMQSFHATEETDLDKIEEMLYETRVSHLGLNEESLTRLKSIQRGSNSFLIKGVNNE